jgi:TRAP-type mannitol/chloroaromatic compound transport system substrate-binding protein
MNRRDFLRTAGTGGAGVAAAALMGCGDETLAQTVDPQPIVNWQMATSWPANLDTLFGGAQIVASTVAALTGNRFTISVHPAGELLPAMEVMQRVEDGTVPIGHTAAYYFKSRSPITLLASSIPFGLTARQQNAWLYDGGGLTLLHEMYARKWGLIAFPAGNSGAQMGGWFNREILTLDDLDGLKMRIGGPGADVMSRLGVEVVSLPGGEILAALEDGTVDAAEWVGPYDDEKLGLHRAGEYYYYPGWWEPGVTLEIQINLAAWNGLPPTYQKALETAATQANVMMLALYDSRNNAALQRLLAGGTQLRRFSDEIMNEAYDVSAEVADEYAAADPDFATLYESWKTFRDGVQSWHSTNELAMETFLATKYP